MCHLNQTGALFKQAKGPEALTVPLPLDDHVRETYGVCILSFILELNPNLLLLVLSKQQSMKREVIVRVL